MTQIMYNELDDLGCSNPWNVQQNIRAGIRELSGDLRLFTGRSAYEQCILGLAAYNAGAGAVKKYGGVPPTTKPSTTWSRSARSSTTWSPPDTPRPQDHFIVRFAASCGRSRTPFRFPDPISDLRNPISSFPPPFREGAGG